MINKQTIQKQSGAVLIVSLVILVALTMLGVTAMRGSLTELTMAGNQREASMTFQAAEAGLRAAETLVETTTSLATYDGSTSLLSETSTDPNYLESTTWTSATESAVTLNNIPNKPKYIIRYLGERNTNADAAVGFGEGFGRSRSGSRIDNFRVTVRGSGQTGNYYRVVQSYYGKVK